MPTIKQVEVPDGKTLIPVFISTDKLVIARSTIIASVYGPPTEYEGTDSEWIQHLVRKGFKDLFRKCKAIEQTNELGIE